MWLSVIYFLILTEQDTVYAHNLENTYLISLFKANTNVSVHSIIDYKGLGTVFLNLFIYLTVR